MFPLLWAEAGPAARTTPMSTIPVSDIAVRESVIGVTFGRDGFRNRCGYAAGRREAIRLALQAEDFGRSFRFATIAEQSVAG